MGLTQALCSLVFMQVPQQLEQMGVLCLNLLPACGFPSPNCSTLSGLSERSAVTDGFLLLREEGEEKGEELWERVSRRRAVIEI